MSYTENNGGCCGGWGGPFGGFMNGIGGFGFEALILLLFFGMWGGGWGGGFGGWGGGRGLEQATTTAAETAALVGQQQVADRVASINTGVDAVAGLVSAQGTKLETVKDAVTNGFFANQTNLCELGNNISQQFNAAAMNGMQNHNNLTSQLTDMRFQLSQCCCDTKQLIQSSFCDLRHDTMQAMNSNTAAIMARIDGLERNAMQDKLAAAQEKIAALKAERDNSQQTAQLAALIQANGCKPSCSPYGPAYPYGFCNPCLDGVQRAVNDALGTRIGAILFPTTTPAQAAG